MGLDVRVKDCKPIICPHCGERAGHTVIGEYDTGGKVWYPFLTEIGYYAPPGSGSTDDWYQKDMVLTPEQTHQLLTFVAAHDDELCNAHMIHALILSARAVGNNVAINADW